MPDTYTIELDARYVDAWLAQHGDISADAYDRWAEDLVGRGTAATVGDALNHHVRAQLLRQVPRSPLRDHLARTLSGQVVLVLGVGEQRALVRYPDGAEVDLPVSDLTYAGPAPEGWSHHEEADDD